MFGIFFLLFFCCFHFHYRGGMLIGPEGHRMELPLFPYFCLKQKRQGHINLNLVQQLDVRVGILLISIRFIGYV